MLIRGHFKHHGVFSVWFGSGHNRFVIEFVWGRKKQFVRFRQRHGGHWTNAKEYHFPILAKKHQFDLMIEVSLISNYNRTNAS